MEDMRTLTNETIQKIGQEVLLQGWVGARRDHGKIMFLDLRDRSGIVQLVAPPAFAKAASFAEVATKAESVGKEDVIEVVGLVKERPATMVNPKLNTGTIEVEVRSLNILSKAHELPFPIDTDGYEINEEVRLKYRYLDMRRPRMNRNLRLRSKMTMFIRNYLTKQDFIEVETPILTKSVIFRLRDASAMKIRVTTARTVNLPSLTWRCPSPLKMIF
ncbi:MAG: Aspartyl-tRNA synthetase [Candidatus Gottesmanbacteria bacterium GW2011_GWA2_44_17]|uniref:Aspartyl-tRNA synthetase n=1 Tax=Candidatus Gottesmanbacteria bacterium GW2011_GWA2_44_17 TaxID=1618444 RepID=A0A0G1HGI3_9BACT|nr:MAG: Aspartyl-tRNA synthetase [Candidatus Gottesmanbacteria bacterium GW2011_GWA2_44_17]